MRHPVTIAPILSFRTEYREYKHPIYATPPNLDRCPPERVVEVLQAVHLILAFELFVVVVAVDPRWLERSLNEAYNSRQPSVGEFSVQNQQYRFSAQNYLEKIFQIPFSLPKMDDGGYRKLISSMINRPKTRLDRAQANDATSVADPDEFVPGADRTSALHPPVDPQSKEPSTSRSKPPIPPGQRDLNPQPVTGLKEADSVLEAKQKTERKEREQAEAQERIEAMLLLEWEEQVIGALYPFISTPRLAKRFINIYRLLRVQAARDEKEFERFIDRDEGEYRVVLMLLAISVGRSDSGPTLIENIGSKAMTTTNTGLVSWLLDASKYYEGRWSKLNKDRIEQNKQSALAVPPSDREKQFKKLSDSANEIHSRLDAINIQLFENGVPLLEDDLELCRKWSREVGRYSFSWHLKWGD